MELKIWSFYKIQHLIRRHTASRHTIPYSRSWWKNCFKQHMIRTVTMSTIRIQHTDIAKTSYWLTKPIVTWVNVACDVPFLQQAKTPSFVQVSYYPIGTAYVFLFSVYLCALSWWLKRYCKMTYKWLAIFIHAYNDISTLT